MQISLDRLVEIIVRQVLAALANRGVSVDAPTPGSVMIPPVAQAASVEIDLTGYRTPVLTENHVRSVERHVRQIVVPPGTICTFGARDAMQLRRITLTYTGKH